MERKIKLNYEEMEKVSGAGIEKVDGFWVVYDDYDGKKIGVYKNYNFAKWADELYKIDGSISPFGWVPSGLI